MTPKLIRNEDLKINDLPDLSDRAAIFRFAMSFNGYEHYGSFEACAEASKSGKRDNVTDIRNELFFAARASRHCGNDEFIERYKEILPLIHKYLKET